MATDAGRFHELFERWARRVRTRMIVRQALTWTALGLLVGSLAALALWKTHQGALRPWMGAVGLVGLAAGAIIGARRRWTDMDVALYLDGRLDTDEVITTAVQMRNEAEADDEARAVVVRQAADALEKADPKKVRPPIFVGDHLLIPIAVAAIVLVARMPMPVRPLPAAPPGSDKVQLAQVEGLEKMAALGALSTPDEAQRERLKQLAERAKNLREKLRDGMERREALSEIAKLKDDVAAERLSLGDAERREGLEAAQGQLAKEPSLKDAAKALGDRDLTRFDEEMQKLANSQEKADRERAKKALEEAADAAKKNGAPDVARALEEEKKLLEERSKRNDALKDLAEGFGKDAPEDLKKDLEEMAEGGTDKDSRKLAKDLGDALEKLTPEERKRLGEKLREKAEKGGMAPMDKERLKDLAKKLATPEGQKQLEEELRKMANEDTESEESKKQGALEEGEKGLGEAEKQLGGGACPMPMPIPGGQQPGGPPGGDKGEKNGPPGSGKSPPGKADGDPGGPGSHHDTGKGDHKGGQTPEIDSKGFRSRASGKINSGAPMPGAVSGRTTGKPGDTAKLRGTGALGEVGPSEIGGVERSDIPEEYREQVGRYFSP